MKLTNTGRDAFVARAMADVPKVDHDEAMRKLAKAAAILALPPAVRKIATDKALSHFVHSVTINFDYKDDGRHTTYFSADVPGTWETRETMVEALRLEMRPHLVAKSQQYHEREALKSMIRRAAYGVSTTKALAELLPAFQKYLPLETVPDRTVPAVAGIIEAFAKAGWPAGKTEVAA